MSKYLDPRFQHYYWWLNSSSTEVKKAFKLFRHETGSSFLQDQDAFREWCYVLDVPTEQGLAVLLQKYGKVFN
jgi:hypothetical protein